MATRRNVSDGWYKKRWEILKRDNYTCVYCGQHAPNVPLEIDHKIPISDGGTDDDDNLVCSCWACNRGKGGIRKALVRGSKITKPKPSPKMAEPRAFVTSWTFPKAVFLEAVSDNPGATAEEIAIYLDAPLEYVRKALEKLSTSWTL